MKCPCNLSRFVALAVLAASLFAQPAPASLLDQLGKAAGVSTGASASQPASNLSTGEIDAGLKEALESAVQNSISQLGRTDGYLGSDLVRIPVPDALDPVASGLRAVGQGELVDEFVTSMNRAAEEAVPETASIFARAIQAMSIDDGRRILQGGDDAATRYFEDKTRPELLERILPIVARATDENNVTASYKAMTASGSGSSGSGMLGATGLGSSGIGGMLQQNFAAQDLDGYVADKALDGLFTIMAREEQAIRQNPAARTSELLQKVFGSL